MDNRQYKKILETLVGILNEGVHIVDEDGISIVYNEAMGKMEQVAPEDILGLDYMECFSDLGFNESTIHQVFQSEKPVANKLQNYVGPSGKHISTVNTTTPVFDENHNVIAAIEVANDITGLKELSDKIMQLQEMMTDGKAKKTVEPKGITRYQFTDLIGENPEFKKCIKRAKRAAKYDVPVLIYGETGTGKELFAQSMHYNGARKDKPFLAQNCAALPENLLEGILFGTSKGGFTGAVDRTGLFEQANGGTLLLDELNSMPIELQGKILRVLQESYIRHIGGSKDIPVDVRIIATVNEDPMELIEQGVLRSDLYYRLNVVNIRIPALRERKTDIPLLAEALIRKHSDKMDKKNLSLSPEAAKRLMEYDYPGNVRELENIMVQALFMVEDEESLTPELINIPYVKKENRQQSLLYYKAGESLAQYMDRVERDIILEAFDVCHGNVSRCAEILHLKRQTLQYKLTKYGLFAR